VGAAVKVTVRLHAVTDDLDVAVLAGRGEGVHRALEAIKGVRVPPDILISKALPLLLTILWFVLQFFIWFVNGFISAF
jgi:hypothetical protein